MSVSHLFIKLSKYSKTWFCVFFILTLSLSLLYKGKSISSEYLCRAPFSFTEIENGRATTKVNGEYHIQYYQDGGGSTSFIGNIAKMSNNGEVSQLIPVTREIFWKMKVINYRLVFLITGNARRVGDHSDDNIIRELIFPGYNKGDTQQFTAFLLNGKSRSGGPEKIPRLICD